jgi:hypothetical protein
MRSSVQSRPSAQSHSMTITSVSSGHFVYMPNPKKQQSNCLVCEKETARAAYKYCSNKCQQAFEYKEFIAEWKSGEIKGLAKIGVVSPSVKRYLRDKYENKCCLCNWAEINSTTGLVPLVADHIDGNWRNNIEENLRLICPNCDSLTSTYAALNKGNGRPNRAISKRARESRFLAERGEG